MVKPKQNGNIERTISELNDKIDPQNVNFINVSKKASGTVIIECVEGNEYNDAKVKLESAMGSNYEIKDFERIKPK